MNRPYYLPFNPTYATGAMILVIFRAKKLEYWNDGIMGLSIFYPSFNIPFFHYSFFCLLCGLCG